MTSDRCPAVRRGTEVAVQRLYPPANEFDANFPDPELLTWRRLLLRQ